MNKQQYENILNKAIMLSKEMIINSTDLSFQLGSMCSIMCEHNYVEYGEELPKLKDTITEKVFSLKKFRMIEVTYEVEMSRPLIIITHFQRFLESLD